ncbi:MAG: hypothetical protein KatS3mg017_0954 [Fimbriimonadales bacterium]|nr:MAG: hypothetical protein KatS3mg017_0438 [Fimbriimonadales bacterium]GIV07752.1 MAG: hypothetical protein KatS3mg017_0954 [Fimbriimonadales bacterium]
MAVLRNAWSDWRKYLVGIFTQIAGNPVIARELRVRVRVGRAYLLQAGYLGFLILIMGLAYEWVISDENSWGNPFQMQQALISFYWVVMGTLITLIVLIAPALTANAITLERERKTIDLLLATPLTARHLLTGKLVASFAFIILLLALTLPICGVAVLLGGVSFGDLLRAYLIIAFCGLVLCAIALFTSVYARNSTMAVLWSYVRVGMFLIVTSIMVSIQSAYYWVGGASGGTISWLYPIALLNPFAALAVADTSVNLHQWQIPSWIVSIVLCLLVTRLILTAAARKVGLYDTDPMPSARRQLLVLLPFYIFLHLTPIFSAIPTGFVSAGSIFARAEPIILVLLCVIPILGLAAWIAPFGDDSERACPNDGVFRITRMFTDMPSGALPFLLTLWLLSIATMGAIFLWTGAFYSINTDEQRLLIELIAYFTGVTIFFWGLGRVCSVITKGKSVSYARALAFLAITILLTLPMIVHLALTPNRYYADSLIMQFWFPKPFIDALTRPNDAEASLPFVAVILTVTGLLLGGLTRPKRQ